MRARPDAWRLPWISLLLLCGAVTACSVPQIRPAADAQTLMVDPQQLLVVTLVNAPTAGLRGAGSTWRGWDFGGGYQVSPDVQGAVDELAARYALAPVDGWPIDLLGVHCVVFRVRGSEPRAGLLQRLAADPRVETVQPLNQFRTTGSGGTGLPPRQMQYSLQALQLEQAHRWTQGRAVRIAIVDTGVDFDHPQLVGRVTRHLDFVGNRGAPFESDRHGTAVAGVIAASAEDGQGIVGVAPRAELLALKACWPLAPGGAEASCNSFTLARALAAAIELEADVLNLSLTGPPDPLLTRLLRVAVDRGVLVVGALPDGALAADGTSFPASVEGVVAVYSMGTAGASDRRAVAAPGEDIITAAPGAAYQLLSGSSFAAAHVSGVAALLRELSAGLSPAQLEALLIDSVRPAPPDGAVSVNACAAVSRLVSDASCVPVAP